MRSEKFFCKKCKRYFDSVKTYEERHGLNCPPYEIIAICPICEGDDFYKFNSYIEKIEIAEKLLPIIMRLNRYIRSLMDVFGDKILNNDLLNSLEMAVEMIVELFDFLDVEMQRKILKMNNDDEMKRIFKYLSGEL